MNFDGSGRLLFYSHDSYGLGHFRRSLTIASHLLERYPSLVALGLTGSPAAHLFPAPERFDYIKLPEITKDSRGGYQARRIPLALQQICEVRANVIQRAVEDFQPDIFLVDHTPLGIGAELLRVLDSVRRTSPRTRVWLGLRDIVDAPERVTACWAEHGIYRALEEYYDRILIYGDPAVFDPVEEYRLSEGSRAKTSSVGYVYRTNGLIPEREVLSQYAPRTGRLVVVTVGGGQDGARVVESWIEALATHRPADFESLVVTGPMMPEAVQRRFLEKRVAGLTVRPFVPALPSHLHAASAVVSMAGYNTVTELLTAGTPMLLIPRIHPRREQLVRAEAFRRLGLAQVVHPRDLTPGVLLDGVRSSIASGRRSGPPPIDLGGLNHLAELARPHLDEACRSANGCSPSAPQAPSPASLPVKEIEP